jgi:hypothetical protein
MNPKIQKTVRELERARTKLAELQALLPELEKQKTELENLEIVRLVRSVNAAPGDLQAFLRTLRGETAAPAPSSAWDHIDEKEVPGDES